ncbi:MAG TPA: TIGR04211 family SH3 domain-containing protein [Gammaproteobacteria bacterium]|nr:TIGR04211 family SH3 domain-containing protein [Gammaproteobacteria bacterium]
MTRVLFSLLLLLLGCLSAVHAAQIRYVSDELIITLRTGQGNQYQIIKTLPTGTRLELLQQTDAGYSKVRTPDGEEGWVRTQYLMDHPSADQQLAAAQAKVKRLQDENSQLQQSLQEARQTENDLKTQVQKLSDQNDSQAKELSHLKEVSATPLKLDRENKDLKEKNIALQRNLQVATQENQSLKDRAEREWFMAGAGVLLAGILLGLIIPKIRWRRKGGWDF